MPLPKALFDEEGEGACAREIKNAFIQRLSETEMGREYIRRYRGSPASRSNDNLQLDATGTGAIEMVPAVIMMANLPTSDPSNAGQLYNDSGTVKISAG